MNETMALDEPTALLVRRAQSGDRDASECLIERYRPRLEGQIASRMGAAVKATLTAEDVFQQTVAIALESIPRFSWQGEASFYSWLGGIAEHVIANASRKKSWGHLALKREVGGSDPSPSRHVRREERFDRLENAVRGLSPEHREALLLSRVEGLKVQEIADRMGRTPNAIYKLLARALIELRERFGDTASLNLPDRRLDLEELGRDE